MQAKDYDQTDISSCIRRLCESIKENKGIDEAIHHLCPLDYSILSELLKKYKRAFPGMAIPICEQTKEYCYPS